MAVSTSTRLATRATVAAAGTSVVPTVVMPDNCHTVIVVNRSNVQTVIIGQGAAGAAIPDDGTNTVIPPLGSVTWDIGTVTLRPDNMDNLIYDCDAGAANADITYLCNTGGDR